MPLTGPLSGLILCPAGDEISGETFTPDNRHNKITVDENYIYIWYQTGLVRDPVTNDLITQFTFQVYDRTTKARVQSREPSSVFGYLDANPDAVWVDPDTGRMHLARPFSRREGLSKTDVYDVATWARISSAEIDLDSGSGTLSGFTGDDRLLYHVVPSSRVRPADVSVFTKSGVRLTPADFEVLSRWQGRELQNIGSTGEILYVLYSDRTLNTFIAGYDVEIQGAKMVPVDTRPVPSEITLLDVHDEGIHALSMLEFARPTDSLSLDISFSPFTYLEDLSFTVDSRISPSGIWSNRETFWLVDHHTNILAYNRRGERDIAKDIDVPNGTARGIWGDGNTLYVILGGSSKSLQAYNLSTLQRDSSKDIQIPGTVDFPEGIWSNGATVWISYGVLDGVNTLLAYNLATGDREPDNDIPIPEVTFAYGIWGDGATIWVIQPRTRSTSPKLFAYGISTKQREEDYDFNTLARTQPINLWSDRDTMWISQEAGSPDVRAYKMPNISRDAIIVASDRRLAPIDSVTVNVANPISMTPTDTRPAPTDVLVVVVENPGSIVFSLVDTRPAPTDDLELFSILGLNPLDRTPPPTDLASLRVLLQQDIGSLYAFTDPTSIRRLTPGETGYGISGPIAIPQTRFSQILTRSPAYSVEDGNVYQVLYNNRGGFDLFRYNPDWSGEDQIGTIPATATFGGGDVTLYDRNTTRIVPAIDGENNLYLMSSNGWTFEVDKTDATVIEVKGNVLTANFSAGWSQPTLAGFAFRSGRASTYFYRRADSRSDIVEFDLDDFSVFDTYAADATASIPANGMTVHEGVYYFSTGSNLIRYDNSDPDNITLQNVRHQTLRFFHIYSESDPQDIDVSIFAEDTAAAPTESLSVTVIDPQPVQLSAADSSASVESLNLTVVDPRPVRLTAADAAFVSERLVLTVADVIRLTAADTATTRDLLSLRVDDPLPPATTGVEIADIPDAVTSEGDDIDIRMPFVERYEFGIQHIADNSIVDDSVSDGDDVTISFSRPNIPDPRDPVANIELRAYWVVDIGDPRPDRPRDGNYIFSTRTFTPPTGAMGEFPERVMAGQVIYASIAIANNEAGDIWHPDENDWTTPVIVDEASDIIVGFAAFASPPSAPPDPSRELPSPYVARRELIRDEGRHYYIIGIRPVGMDEYTWIGPVALQGEDAVTVSGGGVGVVFKDIESDRLVGNNRTWTIKWMQEGRTLASIPIVLIYDEESKRFTARYTAVSGIDITETHEDFEVIVEAEREGVSAFVQMFFVVGAEGAAALGFEPVYAITENNVLEANQKPSDNWRYRQPGIAGGVRWSSNLISPTDEKRFGWQANRDIVGLPEVGDEVDGEFGEPALIIVPGLPGTDGRYKEEVFTVAPSFDERPDNINLSLESRTPEEISLIDDYIPANQGYVITDRKDQAVISREMPVRLQSQRRRDRDSEDNKWFGFTAWTLVDTWAPEDAVDSPSSVVATVFGDDVRVVIRDPETTRGIDGYKVTLQQRQTTAEWITVDEVTLDGLNSADGRGSAGRGRSFANREPGRYRVSAVSLAVPGGLDSAPRVSNEVVVTSDEVDEPPGPMDAPALSFNEETRVMKLSYALPRDIGTSPVTHFAYIVYRDGTAHPSDIQFSGGIGIIEATSSGFEHDITGAFPAGVYRARMFALNANGGDNPRAYSPFSNSVVLTESIGGPGQPAVGRAQIYDDHTSSTNVSRGQYAFRRNGAFAGNSIRTIRDEADQIILSTLNTAGEDQTGYYGAVEEGDIITFTPKWRADLILWMAYRITGIAKGSNSFTFDIEPLTFDFGGRIPNIPVASGNDVEISCSRPPPGATWMEGDNPPSNSIGEDGDFFVEKVTE